MDVNIEFEKIVKDMSNKKKPENIQFKVEGKLYRE